MNKEKKKDKILFLINKLGVGGAERVFVRDANALFDKGFDVYFAFLFGGVEDQKIISDLKIKKENIFYANFDSIYNFSSIQKLSNFIKKNNINIIYSTLNESNIVSRFLKVFDRKLKIFIREANVATPKPFHFKIFDVLFNLFVSRIICVSKEVLQSLCKYEPFYLKKMTVLPNGVDISEDYKKYPTDIVLPVRLLSVGSLTPKKGHKFLIESLGLVNKKYPDSFLLTIIGDGIERENLENMIKKNDIYNKVQILKSMPKSELNKYYLNSDLFVLPSLYEGCPNVLLEALSFGVCSIATNVSGVRDIVEDGVSGRVVQSGDTKDLASAILAIIENRDTLMSKYGMKGREKMINNFSTETRINKLISILI